MLDDVISCVLSARRAIRASRQYSATPLKLRDGSWGARVKGKPRSGDSIRITTRSGKSWTSYVEKVIWSDRDVSIVSVKSNRSNRSSGKSGTCDECGMRSSHLTECGDLSGLGGLCCPRCAKLSRYDRSFG